MFLSPVSGAKRSSSALSEENVTPEMSDTDQRTSSAAQKALSRSNSPYQSPLGTPSKSTTTGSYRICPPLKRGKKSEKPTQDPFPNRFDVTLGSALPNLTVPQDLSSFARTTLTYTDGEATRNICKQHLPKSCGGAALFMLLTDLVRKDQKPREIKPEFWTWYANCEMARVDEIQRIAKETAGITLTISKAPTKTPLTYLKKLLESSNHSIISAITHPQLHGHWIIIDKITDTHTNIRDPNTGSAFSVPNETMKSYYTDVNENVLSVSN